MCMGIVDIVLLEFFTKNMKDIWKYSLFRDKEIMAQDLVTSCFLLTEESSSLRQSLVQTLSSPFTLTPST